MKGKGYIQFSGIVFAGIAILHLLRLIFGWQATLGNWVVPMWASIVALVVAGFFALSANVLVKSKK
ncbi:MAG: hypothetical protein A2958_01055 [Candidatus Levybacteria bacterium RIFCSPLOWO2_01_FULL_38_13]|nr:MAG: hypothetical protein A2629_00950 [Candidatus Levybacteria bacterium RIFCSPHIGHO2_01_FULL_41_15]OGH34876.1 MAG: hypothetical protein A2958_01055 [Candidatus Levybacteria bacterium RIFCSPLOWO2_01_FULL_38_13]